MHYVCICHLSLTFPSTGKNTPAFIRSNKVIKYISDIAVDQWAEKCATPERGTEKRPL
jgi:hypothetical protein